MPHPLVDQLRFTRSEWVRAFEGVTPTEAERRFGPVNLTYHYWYHLGESQAIRRLLGHTELPVFVGDINRAPYRPETAP